MYIAIYHYKIKISQPLEDGIFLVKNKIAQIKTSTRQMKTKVNCIYGAHTDN